MLPFRRVEDSENWAWVDCATMRVISEPVLDIPPATRTVRGPHGDIEIVGEVPEHLPCAEGVKCGGKPGGCRCRYANVVADCSTFSGACLGHLITAMVKAKWDERRGSLPEWDDWYNGPPRVTRIEFPAPGCWDAEIEDKHGLSRHGITSGGAIEYRR